eukprot:CAMPEP_0194320804 /NCGR_PEP_ID=MMETSP0171-20130528/17082_1 /TAXON_ID=218684 /ORGANISM="Corethron pennatum, Strain L29A3" /LENGTH=152 /DNA_ID=CAMNT_0039078469 /DNA_START=207 /DNA_END=665 /DNA_ORIENTATION=-
MISPRILRFSFASATRSSLHTSPSFPSLSARTRARISSSSRRSAAPLLLRAYQLPFDDGDAVRDAAPVDDFSRGVDLAGSAEVAGHLTAPDERGRVVVAESAVFGKFCAHSEVRVEPVLATAQVFAFGVDKGGGEGVGGDAMACVGGGGASS